MLCKILRNFDYSENGFTRLHAEAGSEADIPADLVDGLEADGYLDSGREPAAPTKDAGAAPENKMQAAPLETAQADETAGDAPDELDALRATYLEQTGEEPDKRWGIKTLNKKLGL